MTDDLFAEAYEERAAIAEFDGLLTREQAEALALTESEAWRHSCEVRRVLTMTTDERAEFLKLVAKHRGRPAAQKIWDDAKAAAKAGKQ